MKVFPHGKGRGELPINYLLRTDYPDRDTSPPYLVQGNPDPLEAGHISFILLAIDVYWQSN